MIRITTLLLICVSFISLHSQSEPLSFWDRVNAGIWIGPIFPSGEEPDAYNLSTGYYVGLDARYQLYRFMAIGIAVGTNAWSGDITYDTGGFGQSNNSTDISSSKTNVCLSLHFGPSAPPCKDVTSYDVDISDVRPYSPGMFVPFFTLDIGPYFWSWTKKMSLDHLMKVDLI